MASKIPAAKAAILQVLAARAGLTGVTLSWAGPTKDEDYVEEMVFLGNAERASNWQALAATLPRSEAFTVNLTVYVEQFGDDPQTVEERAFALFDEVEDALRDDIRAGGVLRAAGVLKFDEIRSAISTGPSSAEKWGARIDASVDFQARDV